MKLNEKNELITQIAELLKQLIPEDEAATVKTDDKPAKPEMLRKDVTELSRTVNVSLSTLLSRKV